MRHSKRQTIQRDPSALVGTHMRLNRFHSGHERLLGSQLIERHHATPSDDEEDTEDEEDEAASADASARSLAAIASM